MITPDELFILSYYRAGELAGSLLMGRLAMHTRFDHLRAPLTRHCLEEAEHAWLWTKTIHDLGHTPLCVTHTYQTEYGRLFGMPRSAVEVLCLTQVLERRVLAHFKAHLARPGTHPVIRRSLQQMIDDEEGHLGWVWDELQRVGREGGRDQIDATMQALEAVDRQVYDRLAEEAPFNTYFRQAS